MTKLLNFIKEYHIELFLFLVAFGNSAILQDVMLRAGLKDSWQVTVSIYATELIIVSAGQWRQPGLVIAALMFAATIYNLRQAYPDHWLLFGYMSLTIFAGTVGNYVRRRILASQYTKGYQAADTVPVEVKAKILFNSKGQLDPAPFLKFSVAQLRDAFSLSHNKAKELQTVLKRGETVTKQWLEQNNRPRLQP